MTEYIEKRLALEELENLRQKCEMHDDCDELIARKCKKAVSLLPVADVAPVVHGKLISTGWDESYCEYGDCTVCGADNPIHNKFCGQCGAKLDGGE